MNEKIRQIAKVQEALETLRTECHQITLNSPTGPYNADEVLGHHFEKIDYYLRYLSGAFELWQ